MSQGRALVVLLLGLAFLSISNISTAQSAGSRRSELDLDGVIARSAWRVGRTLVFGGNAERVRFVVAAAVVCQAEFRPTNDRGSTLRSVVESSLVGVKPTSVASIDRRAKADAE